MLALCVLFGWLTSSAIVTWRLTHRDSPREIEPLPTIPDAKVEDLQLRTTDGETIGAWLFRGESDNPCVIVTHGRGSTRRHRLKEITILVNSGYPVIALTHRALGDSTGEIDDAGWTGRHDVIAAVQCAEREFPGQPIVILGQSMGSAAAIFAARDLQERVSGYILEQPYNDLDTAVWRRLQHYLPPFFDSIAYWGMNFWAPVLLPFDIDDVSPEQFAEMIPDSVPVVILCGSDDPQCPLSDVEQVFARVESHGELIVFEADSHAPLIDSSPTQYRSTLLTLLHQMDDSQHRDGQ
ncbi:MAG: alpha/beta fold hydrolase [Planctomycetaceae bacterium]|nr:alpha/beta fold hydrolase [Planctomycetaceae bacterium]